MAVANSGSTAVVVVTEEFTALAQMMAANAGRSGLRVQTLPYPLESRPESEVRAIAAQTWPMLLATIGAVEV